MKQQRAIIQDNGHIEATKGYYTRYFKYLSNQGLMYKIFDILKKQRKQM